MKSNSSAQSQYKMYSPKLPMRGDQRAHIASLLGQCAPLCDGWPTVISPHDQVLRNHSVGSTWIGAASGPRLMMLKSNQQVFRFQLAVFHYDIEVTALVEYSGIDQFKLAIEFGSAAVLLHQLGVWEIRLRIFVEILHVGVAGCVVEVKVIFLDVLSVVALRPGQAK